MLSLKSYCFKLGAQYTKVLRVSSYGIGERFFTTECEHEAHVKEQLKNVNAIPWEKAKPYNQIPGPSTWQFLRSFLPGGRYYKKSTTDMIMELRKEYGTTFRMPGIFGNKEFVCSMDPVDFATVFRNEGIWPERRNFDSFAYYRKVYKGDFFKDCEGVLFSDGESWSKARTAVNPILMQPKNARLYLNTMLEVSDEFLARIREIRNAETLEVPGTFEDDMNRLTFESVAAVALNTQLGLIRKNRDSPEGNTIIKGLKRSFDLFAELDIMPSIWKYVKTPKFYELVRILDTLYDHCTKYINEAITRIETDKDGKLLSEVGKEKSVLEKLLRVDKQLAIVIALDLLFAGVDTASSTITGILLCLAKNPEKQAKLFEEAKLILPEKTSTLTTESIQNMPYLRACIKEGMRLYPILPGTMRKMPKNVVIGGYQVPKGREVSMGFNTLLRDEQYVPRANEFIPERFLRSSTGDGSKLEGAITTPFMFIPFGFGPRSCVGKRIVELEMEINILRLVRNFNIEFNYPIEHAFKSKFINVPGIPLKFKFEERPF